MQRKAMDIFMSKWDKIIIAAIFCVCILSIVFINVFAYSDKADKVIIEVDGHEYAQYRLNEISSSKTIEIDNKYGYNKIEIFPDGACVTDADCRDKLDVLSGKITRTGEYIVCLPHRLVIRLEGGGTYADAVAY
ncbi:MAG: NusG domain II-containing protein [Ruminococcaceae bacterium]|nr:NusG domain II-containing protein [Oscillospiraceae bacterium]